MIRLYTVPFNQYISQKSYGVFWKFGSLWWRDGGGNGGLLITWWEIRDHHFGDMMSKWGPLMVQWKILGPFDDAMGKLETLNKAIGKLFGGAKLPDGKLGPWWCNGTLGGPLMMQWANKRDAIKGKIGAPWWLNGDIGGPRPQIISKRFDTAPCNLFSKLMGTNFNWEILYRWHASGKRIHGAHIPHCSSHISKIVWW